MLPTAASTMKVVYQRSRPASSTSSSPKRSPRSLSRSASRRRRRSFSSGARLRQRPSSKAARADRTARATSSAEPAAAVAICSPVAGSITGIVPPSSEGTTSPSITWPKSLRSSARAVAAERDGMVARSVMVSSVRSSDLNSIHINSWYQDASPDRSCSRLGDVRGDVRGRRLEREALVARGGDPLADLAVLPNPPDVGHVDAGLARDVGAVVPAVGGPVEGEARHLGDVRDPAVLRLRRRLDGGHAAGPQMRDAGGDPLDVLLDRHHHVAQHGGAAWAGDDEEVGEAGGRQAEVRLRAIGPRVAQRVAV